MTRLRIWTVLCGIAVWPLFLFAQSDLAPDVAHRVLVRFNRPVNKEAAQQLLGKSLFTVEEALVPSLDIYSVTLPPSLNKTDAIQLLKGYSSVRWAQTDRILVQRTMPDDPLFPGQWNLDQESGADISAPGAWDITHGGTDVGGNEIVVAIVDNGCLTLHPDLADNIWVNRDEIPGNRIDDDGDGFADDVNGWNAFDNNGTIPTPPNNHGTHVAGIVGAHGNNEQAVTGINWNVKLMIASHGPVAYTSVVFRAYNFVLAQKNLWLATGGARGAFVVAENSSFGVDSVSCQSDSFPAWNDLYDAMGAVGILSACATTNHDFNVDQTGDVPTGCLSPYIISVTNTMSNDVRNTNAGYGRLSIDLGAPGTNVLSTFNAGTGVLSGTSMASPHVAGAVALMYAAGSPDFFTYAATHPDSAALLTKQIILANVDPLPGFDTLTVAGGRLNLAHAVAAIHNYVDGIPSQPFLSYGNQTIQDGSGNNNGLLDAGETAGLCVTLRNFGTSAMNVTATLTTGDPYLTVINGTATFGNIAVSSEDSNTSNPYTIAASTGAPLEHVVVLTLTITADGGYSVTRHFNLTIGQGVTYFDDGADGETTSWAHEPLTSGFGDAWHLETARYTSPGHSWKCGGFGTGSYPASLDAALTSRPISILPRSVLSFASWMDSETSILYPDSGFDGGVVEISADGGPFLPAVPVGGYLRGFRSGRSGGPYTGPMPGRPCFAGKLDWACYQVDLSAYAGQTIRVRFRFGSDNVGLSLEGWYVDDIMIRGEAPSETLQSIDDVVVVPQPTGATLYWNRPFTGSDYYVIYRSNSPAFVPAAGDSVGWTTDTLFTDTFSARCAFYVVTAHRW
jgi:subtilisin family serine protease